MLIVGIVGGTCFGETTVFKKVIEVFPNDEVIIIPQDFCYRDKSK
jgi:uridine kinase